MLNVLMYLLLRLDPFGCLVHALLLQPISCFQLCTSQQDASALINLVLFFLGRRFFFLVSSALSTGASMAMLRHLKKALAKLAVVHKHQATCITVQRRATHCPAWSERGPTEQRRRVRSSKLRPGEAGARGRLFESRPLRGGGGRVQGLGVRRDSGGAGGAGLRTVPGVRAGGPVFGSRCAPRSR